ncbi:MAG: DUF5050 domain-containing protein [Oscillospiraceae bacterium]|nr:DUF5050 domain-containing protein [Oscillospiraceae bacterium]
MAEKKKRVRHVIETEVPVPAKRAALIFFGVLGLVFALALVYVFKQPFDSLGSSGGNQPDNHSNGGRIAFSENTLFYQTKDGAFSAAEETLDNPRRFDAAAEYINVSKGKVYYVNNHVLYSAFYDGSFKTKLADFADKVFVIGTWIFYLDEQGVINKTLITGQKQKSIGIKPTGSFVVSGNTLIFTGENSNLYTARTDGTDIKPLKLFPADKKPENGRFCFDSSGYFYYLCGGTLYGIGMQEEEPSVILAGVEAYCVRAGSYLIYVTQEGLFCRDIQARTKVENANRDLPEEDKDPLPEDVKLAEGHITEVYFSGNNVYFYDVDGVLNRVYMDGTSDKVIG